MDLQKKAYAVKHKNEDVRSASRSGGIFTALSDWVLDNKGVVYGVALSDSFDKAYHKRATTKKERDAFRGSKYIQSETGFTYKEAQTDLENGKWVLYSGTPCQIDGLNRFMDLNKVDTQRLITVDIVCHGVPSQRVWSDFLKWRADGKKIQAVDFRDKKNFGWRDHKETVTIDNEEISSKVYTNLFYSDRILRQSCYKCPYKNTNRISDISIADYWRIEFIDSELDDDKGLSLVILNSEKGNKLFDNIKNTVTYSEFLLANSIQTALSHSYSEPKSRKAFWNDYDNMSFQEIIDKYVTPPKPTAKEKLKSIIKKTVKRMMGYGK